MKWLGDTWLTVFYILCSIFSSVIMASISPARLTQHIVMLVIGFGLYLYLGSQESGVYKSFAILGYFVTIFLLILTYVLGSSIRGSVRWIELAGFQLQAGEMAKPLLVVAFAYFLEKYPVKTLKNILINLVIFLIPALLIFKQPDLGTALVISVIWLVEVFVAGISYFWVGLSGVLGLVGLSFLPRVLHDYQLNRLETFIDPFRDPLGAGYNVIQSIIAVGSGGLFGKGLGHGTQSHLAFLPERHTDFIFASLSEELGLLGSVLIIILIGSIIYRLLSAFTHTISSSSRLILSGIIGYLTFQTFINIGMNIGIAPVTGVTLPLISYGGSSTIATAISLGLAASIIRGDHTRPLIEIH